MNKIIKLMLWAIALMFIIGMTIQVVRGEQPTQQFYKKYLDPLYRESMGQDTNYTYTLVINTPDGVSQVENAMVNFQVWHNPSIRYYLWVDGQTCNTPSFYVSTSYANAGEGNIFFDCSNVITAEGVYNVTLQPDDDTGTITAWMDMTYQNNPDGDFEFFGTEYRPGERARVFLQLRDNQGLPENNGACTIDVYYPLRVNSTYDPLVMDGAMLYVPGSDGLYYYDVGILPNDTGVYMMTAGCNAEYTSNFVYYTDGTDSFFPARTSILGTYSSSTIVLDTYTDFAYTSCSASGGGTKTCQAYYDFDASVHISDYSNATDLSLYYMGEASIDAFLHFEVWNWTSSSWFPLTNNLTYSGLAASGVTGLNDYVANEIPSPTNVIHTNGTIRVRLTATSGTTFQQYNNWLNINLRAQSGTVQELKGSGEIHVNDWFDHYRQSYTDSNWENFTGTINPNILGQITNDTWNYSGTINNNILNQIATAVWNFATRSLTYFNFETAAAYVWNSTINNRTLYNEKNLSTLTATEVWDYNNRTLTSAPVNTTQIAESVWNITGRYTHGVELS